MFRLKILLLTVFILIAFFAGTVLAQETLRLAATTSVSETGFLDYILEPFEEKYGVKVHIISAGSGKAIKLGEAGDVDVILVHARQAEDEFINKGFGVNRRDVMYNDFIIAGPPDDPAKVYGAKDAKEALRRIYNAEQVFVSRGDDSGTDKKEKSIWAEAGIVPREEMYLETGQGMSFTLRLTDEKNAYCLVDRATYLFNKDTIKIRKIFEGDKDLANPYGVIAVNPDRHAHVNDELSSALIGWLVSPHCQEMIELYTRDGEQLYYGIHS